MSKKGLLEYKDPARNAVLLTALLPPLFLKDFKLQKTGIHFYFKFDIAFIHYELEMFLSALSEISGDQFYFKQISDNEAILKVYGKKNLRFRQDLIFKGSNPMLKKE